MKMRSQICQRPFRCVLVGLFLICAGSSIASLWPRAFKSIVSKVVEIRPGGWNYQMWETPPVPIYMDFYFFNWTNPEELLEPGKKPHLVEVGPYRFIETRNKKDVSFNSNYTITFKHERTWYFDEENSVGPSSEKVTTLNAVSFSAAYVARNMNYFIRLPLNHVLNTQPIAITRTVAELLFDGYSDSVVLMGQMGALVNMVDAGNFDKFAWFYTRNASKDFEGIYNMGSGQDDISQVAMLKEWNYKNQSNSYTGACSDIGGSMGERFPPGRTKTEPLTVYSREICRTLQLDFQKETVVEGVNGYRYTAGARMMDNGTLHPSNECYCGGNCVRSGVLNISSCQYGSPGFVSFPHFYQADPYYLDQVEGLKPDAEKHTFYATIEPITGVPLNVAGRLQINILLQPYKSIHAYRNMPKIFFPMLWFEERAAITPGLAFYVRLLLLLSPLGLTLGLLIIVAGVVIIVVALVKYNNDRRKTYHQYSRPPITDVHKMFPTKHTRIYSPTTEDCPHIKDSCLELSGS